MIGVVILSRPAGMRNFSAEPVGLRTLVGERLVDRHVRFLVSAGIEDVLVVSDVRVDVPRALVIPPEELPEHVGPSDLAIYVKDSLVYPEAFSGILASIARSGEELFLASLSVPSPRVVESALGPLYFLGVSVCKGPNFGPCGKPKVVSPAVVFVEEPRDLLAALDVLLSDIRSTRIAPDAKIESDVILEGPVVIESGARIYERTKIVGPAYIGRDVTVGNSSLIRRSAINEGSVVGFSTEVKRSVIEERSTTGRLSYIGDSYIARDVTIVGSVITVNFKPGKPKLGAFIGPGKRILGFNVFEYYTVLGTESPRRVSGPRASRRRAYYRTRGTRKRAY